MNTLDKIIQLKKKDRSIQIVAACLTVVLALPTMFFSFFILGLLHAGSTIFWLVNKPDCPAPPARKILQFINLIVIIVWILSIVYRPYSLEDFWAFTWIMVFIGPVLGISYFLLTLREISFYKKLAGYPEAPVMRHYEH